ncbi:MULTISPECIES: Fe-S cluster assembly protein SufD [Methylocystis]|uniref:Fe-S cluster assembly protein SufD n=1 Tax=Methylocystis bryophila TaxID=655015 RepID=A0A1W6MU19_9HYPH|nr:Fe-S cluster assembly protein SufD [Methylocystis bryophila]ARN80603.1 Fe-S cluster assembly protein SufD [Methylocystis bryophila]ARN80989.1 Fe-S cluster assembly protein SufD [Methylocystis bryophila]BDV36901.1 Fe-S cluster assembly protein SufD [Methylocystis bryophila]BDV40656.1 Fe-S cluster assembly protein SufD [Methylocystis bryophila]
MANPALSATEAAFASLFEQKKTAGAPDLRERSWLAFLRDGLPNRRLESWHYTDLRGALRDFSPTATAGLVETETPPAGVTRLSLSEALQRLDEDALAALAPRIEDPAIALNGALMTDGVALIIPPGAEITAPLSLLRRFSGAGLSVTRSLIVVGAGARVSIVEHAAAGAETGGFENDLLILALGAGAKVEHCLISEARADGAASVMSLVATLAEDASLDSFSLIEGGGLLRRQIFAKLTGAKARVRFNGASLLRGASFSDTTLVVEHLAPQGESREAFRSIVDDTATGVFQGKISVAREAQKTDGSMQSKALLLSDTATMNNKPELEIFADDVACGHGATCGRLDADQLFYLTARGIPKAQAEALLIEGFANEAFAQLEPEPLREALAARVSAWLAPRRIPAEASGSAP